MRVNILGTEYAAIFQREEENQKLATVDGLCETYTKKQIIYDFEPDITHVDSID